MALPPPLAMSTGVPRAEPRNARVERAQDMLDGGRVIGGRLLRWVLLDNSRGNAQERILAQDCLAALGRLERDVQAVCLGLHVHDGPAMPFRVIRVGIPVVG